MPTALRRWLAAAAIYTDRRAITLFLLGIAAGLPFLLIFSSLSIWLNEAGVARDTVTRFSWAALAYSFKFVWSPLADALPLPLLTRTLGRRRAWLLLAQCGVIAAICLMALIDPARPGALPQMALAAVLLGFSSATQDIVIDAYRIEIAPHDAAMQAATAASYTAGYRCGMILSGAGALLLAGFFGSTALVYHYPAWRSTYLIMAALMGIGIATTLLVREPPAVARTAPRPPGDNLRLLALFAVTVAALIAAYRALDALPAANGGILALLRETLRLAGGLAAAVLAGMLLVRTGLVRRELAWQTWLEPLADFFRRYGRAALLLDEAQAGSVMRWLAGSLSNLTWSQLHQFWPWVLLPILPLLWLMPKLNLLRLSDDAAQSLGLSVRQLRGMVNVFVLLWVGASVAITGPIAFIGLLVPHLAKFWIGYDLRLAVPMSALLGALLLVAADVLAIHLAHPAQLPAGAVLAIIGAPCFVLLAKRRSDT